METIMSRFSSIAEKLADNQVEMRMSIQQLSDNFKLIEKMDRKIEDVENKVDKNSQMVYKLVGGVVVLSVLAPFLLGKLF